jgi:type IX secretion system PorP/SprF family membrane protein
MKRYLLIAFLFLTCTQLRAQDFTFSQFYEKPLLRNPALAGIFSGDIRVSAAHRSQWGSVTVPFTTSAISIENKIPFGNANDFITIGVQATNDMAGDVKLKRTQVLPALNYHKSLSGSKDSYLSLAFMGGLATSQFDPTLMKLADQFRNGSYNPNNATSQKVEENGYNYWDASTGLSYNSTIGEAAKFYVGAALYHFNKPKVAFNSTNDEVYLDQRYTVNGGLNLSVSDYGRVVAFADYIRQGKNRQLLAGLMYGMDIVEYYDDEDQITLYFGSFWRAGDAIIPMIKLDRKNVSMAISYDTNISKLHVASNWRGGFELTLVYKAFLKINSTTLEKVFCPRF